MTKGTPSIVREHRLVAIDSVSEWTGRHGACDAVVLVDVVCDTTTLVTSVAQGRSTFTSASGPAAQHLARSLREPILAAEPAEPWRPGFDFAGSPAALATRTDRRPLILACPTGATLARNEVYWPEVYLACFRNAAATARHLAAHCYNVLILDGACDGDVRCEDQMVAARIAAALVDDGFEPIGLGTHGALDRWARADIGLVSWGRSAEELRSQRRHDDIAFVVAHVDDLDLVCSVRNGRAVPVGVETCLHGLSSSA